MKQNGRGEIGDASVVYLDESEHLWAPDWLYFVTVCYG
jgi:hypothetical protein